jgi:hypothetical protein
VSTYDTIEEKKNEFQRQLTSLSHGDKRSICSLGSSWYGGMRMDFDVWCATLTCVQNRHRRDCPRCLLRQPRPGDFATLYSKNACPVTRCCERVQDEVEVGGSAGRCVFWTYKISYLMHDLWIRLVHLSFPSRYTYTLHDIQIMYVRRRRSDIFVFLSCQPNKWQTQVL